MTVYSYSALDLGAPIMNRLPVLAVITVLILGLILVVMMGPLNHRLNEHHNTRPRPGAKDSETVSKAILFWSKYYSKVNWQVDAGTMKCGPYTCDLTYDKKEYSRASAVMFHHRSMQDWLNKLPPSRLPEQRWVLYYRESTWWNPKGRVLNRANNLMNWTMGFRSDDDITIPTAIITKGQFGEGYDPNRNYLYGKTGDVVGLMSWACRRQPPGYATRANYIDSLQKHGLKLDVYGKCGEDCGAFSNCSIVLRKYKFVLAFENSLCDDYITEKPYRNALMLGVVPIVMSGANLSDPYILPPGSFIDGLQFTSVSALSKFLKRVGSDPKLYNKYFEWRKDWNFKLTSVGEGQEKFSRDYFCPLCRKLHEDHRPKVIRHLQKWFEQEKCKEYPKMSA